MSAPLNLLKGQAGVYRVASELLLRGVNVSFPVVDDGVDILTVGGARIQVKAAKLGARKGGNGERMAYNYTLNWKKSGAQQKWTRRPYKYSEEVDFLVFWGIDEDRFWIIPSQHCDDAQCLLLWARDVDVKRISAPFVDGIYSGENRWELLIQSSPANERKS